MLLCEKGVRFECIMWNRKRTLWIIFTLVAIGIEILFPVFYTSSGEPEVGFRQKTTIHKPDHTLVLPIIINEGEEVEEKDEAYSDQVILFDFHLLISQLRVLHEVHETEIHPKLMVLNTHQLLSCYCKYQI